MSQWPTLNPDSKPRKSFWEKLGSWSALSLGYDSDELLHAATYFFYPTHDYLPVLFPVLNLPQALFLVANDPVASPTQPATEAEPEPASQPETATVPEPEPGPCGKT
ncbi:hypothetical protein BY996DRAFT_6415065 [Phakopsora pachyrhizi]|nr:hypothetical protein BY996DRAFT_6415065 [Phakopsora pachyrhizi]